MNSLSLNHLQILGDVGAYICNLGNAVVQLVIGIFAQIKMGCMFEVFQPLFFCALFELHIIDN